MLSNHLLFTYFDCVLASMEFDFTFFSFVLLILFWFWFWFNGIWHQERQSSKELVVFLVDASPKMFNVTCPGVWIYFSLHIYTFATFLLMLFTITMDFHWGLGGWFSWHCILFFLKFVCFDSTSSFMWVFDYSQNS